MSTEDQIEKIEAQMRVLEEKVYQLRQLAATERAGEIFHTTTKIECITLWKTMSGDTAYYYTHPEGYGMERVNVTEEELVTLMTNGSRVNAPTPSNERWGGRGPCR
jgi:hypothetical protein